MRIKEKTNTCLVCNQRCYGAKYCTNCYTRIIQKDREPWNKGKKTGIIPKTAFVKGVRFNPEGEFKKGHGKSFKGTPREYKASHYWVTKSLGTASWCCICEADNIYDHGKKNDYEWANKSHMYKHDLSDWMPLCKECHFAYDHK